MLKPNYTLKIESDSEAEKYFCNDLMKLCKDKVTCRLGVLYGVPYNEYVISENDYMRIREHIKSKKRA